MTLSFRDRPIVWKLMAVALATVLIALVVSTSVSLWTTYSTLRSGVENDLEGQAGIIAENTSSTLAFDDPVLANETLRTLRLMPSVDLGCLYAADGKLFASFPQPPIRDHCDDKPPPIGKSVVNGKLHVTVAVTQKERQLGVFALRGNLSRVRDQFQAQVFAAFVGMILAVGAAVLLSLRLQRLIARPIVELSSTAHSIARAGDYTLRATKANDDEIGRLVVAFNTMVAEVERRDEQLRGANRLKDEFLATLSHELRTPLNAVFGWIQILRAGGTSSETVARAYESIDRNARAQATLIEDLLDISRIVTGKLRLRSEPVDLKTIAENALEVAKPGAEAKRIALNRQLPDGPAEIVGDPDRLQQIAWNLLSNAVKFTPAGGAVDVSLVGGERDWKLIVRDTGSGIDPAFLPHVFDRFRQADGSITRRHGGLGLGLAIVHELTELHGGRIEAASAGLNRGATFTATFPRMAATAPIAARVAPQPHRELEGYTVLVVDDDADAREVTAAAVQSAGGVAVTAPSGAAAIDALASHTFDAALFDLAMPQMDGFELLRHTRIILDATKTPAIAVSAHAGAEEQARQAGFQAFIAKPYDLDTLVSGILQAKEQKGTGSLFT